MKENKLSSKHAICKVLSPNDTGETGSHQAGILIPKNPDILSFFPELSSNVKNPRIGLVFYDGSGVKWEFAFIYYNNHLFGGTRNEYRVTRMTPYIRSNNLKAGDEITFSRDFSGKKVISFERRKEINVTSDGKLHLGYGWKIIKL